MSTFTIYISTILAIILVTGITLQSLNTITITIISLILFTIAIILKVNNKISLKPELPELKINKFIIILLIITIITVIYKIFAIVITPSYAYDANVYHLPNLIDYIQKGRIYLSEKIIWSDTYPRNFEMFNLWNMIFTKSRVLAEFAQVFLSIYGAIAVYGILKLSDVEHNKSILGGILFITTPIVLAQMSTGYIDTAIGAIIIAILYFMCCYFKSKSNDTIAYMSLLLGILLGSKYSSISYVAVLVIAFVVIDYLTREENKFYKNKYSLKNIYIVLILIALLGSSWYLENFKNFGNPIHPFNIKVSYNQVLEGWDVSKIMTGNTPTILKDKNKFEAILISWIGLADDKIVDTNKPDTNLEQKEPINKTFVTMYDMRIGGFGFGWLYIMIPSFIIYIISLTVKKKGSINDIIVIVLPLICFLITPSNWWTRYVCFILITGIYCFAKIFSENIVTYSVISLLIVFNCITGSMFDIIKTNQTLSLYNKASGFAIDSVYHISDNNMKDIIKNINNKRNLIFAVGNCRYTDVYFYFGEKLQNEVKCYYNGYDKYLKNYNIFNHKDLNKFIEADKPDYIIISSAEERFYNKGALIKSSYKKIVDGEICLFKKSI